MRASFNPTLVRFKAISYAVQRGVNVQAFVAPSAKGWNKRNKELAADHARLGVQVRITRPRRDKLKRYHYKIMMIDEQLSLIFVDSQNLRRESLDQRREVGIIVQSVDLAQRIERIFVADWLGDSEGMFVRPVSPAESRVTSRI